MNKRILVLLTVVPLMVLLVFFVATAAIAQSQHGELKRTNACFTPAQEHLPFECTR
jgi:hypothetical protein